MEPASVAAAFLKLVSHGRTILLPFATSEPLGDLLRDDLLVFEVHLGILEEISQLTLASTLELPPSAKSCARLCQGSLTSVQKLIPEAKRAYKFGEAYTREMRVEKL